MESNDVTPGLLSITLSASIVEEGHVRRIKFGTTGACDYPGPMWTKVGVVAVVLTWRAVAAATKQT